jgi:hypothetical protein
MLTYFGFLFKHLAKQKSTFHNSANALSLLQNQAERCSMPEHGDLHKKQDFSGPSRKQLWAIWVAVGTALGSTGIPKLIEVLEDRPSTEQVQGMIAQQTMLLTEAQNNGVEAFRELQRRVQALQEKQVSDGLVCSQIGGKLTTIQDVMRTCCIRYNTPRRAPARPTIPSPVPPAPAAAELLSPGDIKLEMLEKVPAFSAPIPIGDTAND